MATITSTLQLNDRMSAALERINASASLLADTLGRLGGIQLNNLNAGAGAAARTFDTQAVNAARIQQIEQQTLNQRLLAEEQVKAAAEQTAQQRERHEQQLQTLINQNTKAEKEHSSAIMASANSAKQLLDTVSAIAATYLSIKSVKAAVETSDTLTSIDARLNFILDDGGSIDAFKARVMDVSNETRADYADTANFLARIGTTASKAFSSNEEQLAFVEQLNKQFVITQRTNEEIASAQLQLSQALSADTLQGEELRSLRKTAPALVQGIEEYMNKVMGMEGTIKDFGKAGVISADIIKAALFNMADETNAKFDQMPYTWQQRMAQIKNYGTVAFQGLFSQISALANNQDVMDTIYGVVNALAAVGEALALVIAQGAELGMYLYENWDAVAPVIWAVVLAMAAFKLAELGAALATAAQVAWLIIKNAVLAIAAAVTFLAAAATGNATAAQWALNAAMLASPVTWIVVAIIALIGLLFMVIKAIYSTEEQSASTIGVIGAMLGWLGSIFYNLIADIWNLIASFGEFFANFLNDPIGSIVRLVVNMADFVLGVLQTLAGGIDALFGSNMSDAIQGWRDDMKAWADENIGEAQIKLPRMEKADTKQWMDVGYEFGAGIEDKLGGLMEGFDPTKNDFDYAGMAESARATAENTGKTAKDLEIATEDLKYLRDMAEAEAINRFTSVEVSVPISNQFTNGQRVDIDGIVGLVATALTESIASSAEGVHH